MAASYFREQLQQDRLDRQELEREEWERYAPTGPHICVPQAVPTGSIVEYAGRTWLVVDYYCDSLEYGPYAHTYVLVHGADEYHVAAGHLESGEDRPAYWKDGDLKPLNPMNLDRYLDLEAWQKKHAGEAMAALRLATFGGEAWALQSYDTFCAHEQYERMGLHYLRVVRKDTAKNRERVRAERARLDGMQYIPTRKPYWRGAGWQDWK